MLPFQDCLAAVQWVKKNIWTLGGDRTRMAFVGESSGGNLAMATGDRNANACSRGNPRHLQLTVNLLLL